MSSLDEIEPPYFNESGYYVMPESTQEPVCPICAEKIRWVLDMSSYSTLSQIPGQHGYVLCHARCVWLPNAFTRERTAAKAVQRGRFQK